MMNLGLWIEEKLDMIGKSKYWLSNVTGISHSAFAEYRDCNRYPRLDKVNVILHELSKVMVESKEQLLIEMFARCFSVEEVIDMGDNNGKGK